MFTVNTSDNLSDISDIPRTLAQQISATVHADGYQADRSVRLHRITIPVPSIDLLTWLSAQSDPTKLYWSTRSKDAAVAAVGAADIQTGTTLEEYRKIIDRLRPVLTAGHGKTKYFGGFHFQPDASREHMWTPFGAFRFILPRFELHDHGEYATLVCNILLPADRVHLHDILSQVNALVFPENGVSVPTLSPPLARSDTPDRATWKAGVQEILNTFDSSLLEKTVLARRTTFDFEQPLDPVHLLKHLHDRTPACFHFLMQINESMAFLGASPERLYRRKGRTLDSEAVAGTRPRGATAHEDVRLTRELRGSQKDHQEHQFVRRQIRSAVQPLCRSLHEERELSIMKLATKQHLLSRLQGVLDDDSADGDLLEALHPTPAVAGHPTPEALTAITKLEPFDRGWYAGPIGWIGPDAAEFAVAIRSGLIENRHLHLYAGAGIVEASDPDSEWNELEQKISDFVQILTTEE